MAAQVQHRNCGAGLNRVARIMLFAFLFLFNTLSSIPAQTAAIPEAQMQKTNSIDLRVLNVEPQTNYLGRAVMVTVTDASNLLYIANQTSKKIALFVNGNELSDLQPIVGKDLQSNTFTFLLERTSSNKDVWAPLFRNPILNSVRPLIISVGVQGSIPLIVDPKARDRYLWVIGWNWWTIGWLSVFAILLFIFILCAIYTNMLRGSHPDSTGRLPYSLSRTQAAFWLFIVSISFVFIWAVTGDVSTINGSVLGLIGISAGTYLAATITEKNQAPPSNTAASTSTNIPSAPANQIPNAIANIQKIRFIGHFLADILSESGDTGVSVHKFQVFVWTIIVGIIFMVSVINELNMPELNGTLLALMGISSATYIGAKLNQ
jgi:hypothetical protein